MCQIFPAMLEQHGTRFFPFIHLGEFDLVHYCITVHFVIVQDPIRRASVGENCGYSFPGAVLQLPRSAHGWNHLCRLGQTERWTSKLFAKTASSIINFRLMFLLSSVPLTNVMHSISGIQYSFGRHVRSPAVRHRWLWLYLRFRLRRLELQEEHDQGRVHPICSQQ